jgi:hypothetical protein
MRKNLLLPLMAILSCSCATGIPLAHKESDNNVTYKVDYLFEHEGCKVYRFYDRGNEVYFTNCKGEAIAKTDSTETRNSIRRY